MNRLLVRHLAVVALTVPLVSAGAAQAKGKTLPKGTPYAAEVSAEITGTVKMSQDFDNVTQNVCEDKPDHVAEHEQFLLNWKARYPHITVPVAGKAQLGKAYARLHVPVTPTSSGTGGLAGGGYEIDGTAPTTDQTCDQVRFTGSGKMETAPFDPLVNERNVLVDDMAGGAKPRTIFGFLLGTVDSARPATVTKPRGAGESDDVATAFRGLEDTLPPPAVDTYNNPPPTYNSLALDLPFERFRPLLKHATLTVPIADAGTIDCGRSDPGISTSTCTDKYDYAYTVVLHRKFLYKTVRAYPR